MDAGTRGQRRSAEPQQQSHNINMDSTDMTANEMNLREQLLSASHQQNQSPQTSVAHPVQSPPPQHQISADSPTPPQHQHAHGAPPHMDYQAQHQRSAIDPAIAAQYSMQHVAQQSSQLQQGGSGSEMEMGGMGPPQSIAPMPEGGLPGSPPGQDSSPDGRKARRELSQSKRAAQNRAAQRAFRQRKESYIKKLEDDVRNAAALPALQEEYHRVQSENYHLRDYIMALQSRLLEVNGDYPPPPSNIDLRDPRQFQQQNGEQAGQAPMASMGGSGAVDQLQAAAAQAAGFGGGGGADVQAAAMSDKGDS